MKILVNHCSRELSEQLHKLKICLQPVKKDEVDEWEPGDVYSVIIHDKERIFILGEQEDSPYDLYQPIRLISISELLNLLPFLLDGQVVNEQRQFELFMGKDNDGQFVGYFNGDMNMFYHKIYDTLANAQAKMLIELQKQGTKIKTYNNY